MATRGLDGLQVVVCQLSRGGSRVSSRGFKFTDMVQHMEKQKSVRTINWAFVRPGSASTASLSANFLNLMLVVGFSSAIVLGSIEWVGSMVAVGVGGSQVAQREKGKMRE